MKPKNKFTIQQIAHIIEGTYIGENKEISKIVWNSKECCPGCCYIAIRGEKYDGNAFIDEARSKGAELIITDAVTTIPNGVYLRVEDSKKALGLIAKNYAKSIKIIGITGSVGKTTVKEMIKTVMSEKYSVTATLENENNEIGVAKTLLSCSDEEFCIVEMGMRARGEIAYLAELCRPETSIITNSGSAHIGLLGSVNEIFDAKTEILEYTKKYCILPYEKRFIKIPKNNLSSIYIGARGDFSAENIVYQKCGVEYSVYNKCFDLGRIFLPTFSKHNITNSLFAYSVGNIYGIEHKRISNALKHFTNTKMREEILCINNICLIVDCYNASYEGMKSAIESFNNYCKLKKFSPNLVLGLMKEMGDYSDEYHYRIGEYAKDIGIHSLIVYGESGEKYTDGYCGGEVINDKNTLAQYILSNYGNGDAILFKGSRSIRMEEIINEMKELVK
ncbi:MAG: UDP-N-acetylmuramoyl-tripeptide--D-alanyl-D-alanine ligase [Clostridia bacterium]|nr:UDP-N-acetylmuramoyl-tripeptide--D-alanyl-D-alanine ligase [Clostridia bacterium]